MSEVSTGKDDAVQNGNVKYSQVSGKDECIQMPENLEKNHAASDHEDHVDERTHLQVTSDSVEARKLEDVKISDIDEPYAPPYKQTTSAYEKPTHYPVKGGRLKRPKSYIVFAWISIILNPLFGIVAICLSWASHGMSDDHDEECNELARRLGLASRIVGAVGIAATIVTLIIVLPIVLT
ncbi:uncharacterized protein LOC106164892 [Lingula anatina]|uniref:Uncharacterized protein LOC106164892 n=1 Tax=Lingula anatina TaxID=7574 RepID=A0A1S3IJV1_LINAN|nr:uncharacterized protein LOC106164892 [Lingula anatina]XP_013398387.1 uncharacterized protein LOC106164892 [Lingula anatina]XP_013398388.1 uncharacterized protein LOC106164892 [Lingula anatina]|eukprot:XP_013398386.1 uncharacterized protein LOC106164892 [Lingula anatina]